MEAPNLADLVKLDDPALIAWQQETRTGLERNPDEALQAIYDATTREIAIRAGGQRTGGMSDSARMYEQMSDPLLMMQLRHLRVELEKLTVRAEAAIRELDKRLTARKRPEQTGGDLA